MSRLPKLPILLAAFLILTTTFCAKGRAQDAPKGDSSEKTIEIPKAAYETEQGRFLAIELRNLLRTRSTLGSKHPTLPMVEARIEEISQLLEPYRTVAPEPAPNPFQKRGENAMPASRQLASPPTSRIPTDDDQNSDLRVLLVELMQRVRTLELRVEKLEQKLR
ncbi:hypothetical protein FYK55_05285 [Roseiconus nitratireducens]|uniref:Secreted protein n=1 Tax=Roseiconus nitratireducens TaxID=2605748 RepID=A0A5M6DFL4_9BACT|nr:hypothetical protein [Roseiconus nitratireducens]KAA5546298.1 hypothetical protein FYK55_05285 [Roseiconus nitratireducens]